MFDSIWSAVGVQDNGEDEELTGELFAFVAAVLDWLNENNAFLFGKTSENNSVLKYNCNYSLRSVDATQWNLGTLLPGDDIASELAQTTDLTAELIAIFLSTPVDVDNVSYDFKP